jgi:hypothetical protein
MVGGSRAIVSNGGGCKLESTDVIFPPFGAERDVKKCSVMDGPESRGDSCPFSRSVRCSSPCAVCRGRDEGEVVADYARGNASGDEGLREIMKSVTFTS